MLGFLFLAVSAGLLLAGAELFAEHAAAAGRRLRLTGVAIGILLAGAEPEELVTALVAAARDRPGIAVGDAVGANVTILTLILGLAALVRPVPMHAGIRRYAFGAAILGGAASLVVRDGDAGRVEGALLLAVYAAFVSWVWWRERRPPPIGEATETFDEDAPESATRGLLLALVGVGVMTLGGWLAVVGAERVVELLDTSDSRVGLTFVALATTAELLALVWAAGRRALDELAVAGMLGSVAYNATVTLGAAALTRPLAAGGSGGAALLATVLPLGLIVAGARGRALTRPGGALLLGGYVTFVLATLA